MTIDEAIKIKENDPPMPHPLDLDKIDESDRLSIEALKRIQYARQHPFTKTISPLPGETKE